ncbi:hypothetical protein HPB50_020303 [Hyalomma asiaticum]|uniref:Uncharacterized protein n=1 Tax=Hyalomma asiaticum TaxID=266040 RepID=A0ACB7RV80_HYAAI|nr:hypothetical protein HPB50_020303 [Hyalomma asiaticum]
MVRDHSPRREATASLKRGIFRHRMFPKTSKASFARLLRPRPSTPLPTRTNESCSKDKQVSNSKAGDALPELSELHAPEHHKLRLARGNLSFPCKSSDKDQQADPWPEIPAVQAPCERHETLALRDTSPAPYEWTDEDRQVIAMIRSRTFAIRAILDNIQTPTDGSALKALDATSPELPYIHVYKYEFLPASSFIHAN